MDASRPHPALPSSPDRQLQLTRNHLFALGALALSLAVLAFFVGMQLGKTTAPPVAAAPPVAPLVGEEARTGDLEVLLAKVEQAGVKTDPLAFPAELPVTVTPPAPIDPAATPVEPAPPAPDPFPDVPREGSATVAAGPATAGVVDGVPADGWAIQVASRDGEADAQALVETLRAAGLAAYRVVALVDGQSTWRVRVGGYRTKDAAAAALGEVSGRAGSGDAVVTPAP
ncbi:MAG: SPOR domain-containing protein [Myxococcota bacterium]